MLNINEILQFVAELEHTVFHDAWSEESIKSSMNYEYNYILAAYTCEERMNYVVLQGCNEDCGHILSDGSFMEKNSKEYCFAGYIIFNTIQEQAELMRIAVVPELRKKGVATEMIKKYHSLISKKTDTGFLEVRQNNTGARRLYEKTGYSQIGVRKNYYKNPVEDGVIYHIEF